MDMYEQTARMIVRTQGIKKGLKRANSEIKRLKGIGNDEGAQGWREILQILKRYEEAEAA